MSELDEKANGINGREESRSKSKRKKTRRSPWLTVLAVIIIISLWGGMIYGGYYYAKQYFDQSINNVQQTNAMNIQKLEDRVSSLAVEMEEVKNALKDADQTLSSSDDTQQELNDKINKLNNQLKDLERSLRILKEAPDAAN